MSLPIRNRGFKETGNCRRILRLASALYDDEASPQAALEIRRHLLDCAGCRDRTDEMTRLVAVLESLPAFDPPPDLEDRQFAGQLGYAEVGVVDAGALSGRARVQALGRRVRIARVKRVRHAEKVEWCRRGCLRPDL